MRFPFGIRALLPAVVVLIPLSAVAETITGTVRDALNGVPLRSMVAAAYNSAGGVQANTTTDITGRYELTVPAGSYRVLAYDPLGAFATQFADDAPSFEESPVTVVSGPQPVTVNFALKRGGTVSGTVITSGGIRPGFTVAAYNLSGTRRGTTLTGAGGAYSMVLPPGTYKMVTYDDAGAFAPAFYRDRQTFTDADVLTVTAAQTVSNIDFFVQLGARLAGAVTDAASGGAVPGAVVLAYNASGFQITFAIAGPDGRFVMTVPPGSYRFVAVDPAYKLAAGYPNGASSFEGSPEFVLAGGQNRNDLNFRLEPGGRVTGTVIDAKTGAGLRNITVAAYNGDGSLRTFVNTDANGDFTLLLPPGDFRIAAFDVALIYATQFYAQSKSFAGAVGVASSVGQIVTLQPFTLSHGGHIAGTVTDPVTGARISGAVVSAYDTLGLLIATTTTFSAGTYRLILPAGSYRLIAYDRQLRYAPAFAGGAPNFESISPVTIAADADATLNFTLRRGTVVSGSVTEESHEPIAGMQVDALDLNRNRVASATTAADGSFRLAVVPGNYKFMAWDPDGRYRTSFMGGTSFETATTISVEATGAPRVIVIVDPPARRRAVRHH